MKKITDERLKLRNLENIRIIFAVQTIGILLVLGYDLIQGGMDQMTSNPLWLVFLLTMLVSNYLTMSIGVEKEKVAKNPKKSFIISLIVVLVIAIAVAYFTSITPGFGWSTGLWLSAVIIICGTIPCYYTYRLQVKQQQEFEEE